MRYAKRKYCPNCGQIIPRGNKLRATIRVSEVAGILGCSPQTVRNLTTSGKIKCYIARFPGNHRRYDLKKIENYKKLMQKGYAGKGSE